MPCGKSNIMAFVAMNTKRIVAIKLRCTKLRLFSSFFRKFDVSSAVDVLDLKKVPALRFFNMHLSIGGSKRGAKERAPSRGPISFIFMQFLMKFLSNNRFSPQTQRLVPLHLGNLGSATALT